MAIAYLDIKHLGFLREHSFWSSDSSDVLRTWSCDMVTMVRHCLPVFISVPRIQFLSLLGVGKSRTSQHEICWCQIQGLLPLFIYLLFPLAHLNFHLHPRIQHFSTLYPQIFTKLCCFSWVHDGSSETFPYFYSLISLAWSLFISHTLAIVLPQSMLSNYAFLAKEMHYTLHWKQWFIFLCFVPTLPEFSIFSVVIHQSYGDKNFLYSIGSTRLLLILHILCDVWNFPSSIFYRRCEFIASKNILTYPLCTNHAWYIILE